MNLSTIIVAIILIIIIIAVGITIIKIFPSIGVIVGVVLVGIVVGAIVELIQWRSNKSKQPNKSDYEFYTYTKVAGVTFNSDNGTPIQRILPNIPNNAFLMLIREPNNQYDSNAIKVVWNNNRIGYLPHDLAYDLAPIIDGGKNMIGYVDTVTGRDKGTYGCNISVWVEK